MTARVTIVDRIIAAIAIQVQAVDGFGVQVGGIVGRDESAPFGGVIPGVAVIQASVISSVIATVTNMVDFGPATSAIFILPSSPPTVNQCPPAMMTRGSKMYIGKLLTYLKNLEFFVGP
jgi:hypothetical protein